jgi:hypothetical protein
MSHDENNADCPINDPETFANPALPGMQCSCNWTSQAKDKIAEFNNDHGHSREKDVLLVRKLRKSGLNDEQIAAVLTAIGDVCHECWDSERGCRCWDDS